MKNARHQPQATGRILPVASHPLTGGVGRSLLTHYIVNKTTLHANTLHMRAQQTIEKFLLMVLLTNTSLRSRPVATQIWKAYVTARLSNQIIASNKIIRSAKPVPVYILVDKDRGPVYAKRSNIYT